MGATPQHLGECLDGHRVSQPGRRGPHRVAFVVDLLAVVEDHHLGRTVAGECEFRGGVDMIDAGGDEHRFGLGHDRAQRLHGGAGLQRHRDRAELDQGEVDDGVVDAGESEDCDAVAGAHPVGVPRVGARPDAVEQLPVGDGVEAGEQLHRGAAGLRVGGEFGGALPECRPVGVPRHDGGDDGGQPRVIAVDGIADPGVGPGGGELRVGGEQMRDALLQARFTGLGGHDESSRLAIRFSAAPRCAP